VSICFHPYSNRSAPVSLAPHFHRVCTAFGEQTVSSLSTAKQLRFDFGPHAQTRNRRLAGQLARQGTVLALYLTAVHTVIHGDRGRAWTRQQIWGSAVSRNLVTGHANGPLLNKALDRLMERGEIVRVARGYYRAAGRETVGVGIAKAAQ
jgi:hypothetical protein